MAVSNRSTKKNYEVITPCLAGYAESSLFEAPQTINENAILFCALILDRIIQGKKEFRFYF